MTRLALDALLEINAPLGVLYRHFLQDAWVRAQLSSSTSTGGGNKASTAAPFSWPPDSCAIDKGDTAATDAGTPAGEPQTHNDQQQDQEQQPRPRQNDMSHHQGLFTVAVSIFEAIEYSEQQGRRTAAQQPLRPVSIYEKTQTLVVSEIPTLHHLILAEYILARLYSEGGVSLARTPFLAHFLRIYVQVPPLRFLMHRILGGGATAAELSSMPVAAVLNCCVKIAYDVRGNALLQHPGDEASGDAADTPTKTKTKTGDSATKTFGAGYVAGRRLEWILSTLTQFGASEAEIDATLTPTDPIDILDRLQDVVATTPVHAGEHESRSHERGSGTLLAAFHDAVLGTKDWIATLKGAEDYFKGWAPVAAAKKGAEDAETATIRRPFESVYLRNTLPLVGVDATTMEPLAGQQEKSAGAGEPQDSDVENFQVGLYRTKFLQLVRSGVLEQDAEVSVMTMEGAFTPLKGRILEGLLRIMSYWKYRAQEAVGVEEEKNNGGLQLGLNVRQVLLDCICEGIDTFVSNSAADFVFRLSTGSLLEGAPPKFLVERGDELRQLIYGVVLRWLEGVNSLTRAGADRGGSSGNNDGDFWFGGDSRNYGEDDGGDSGGSSPTTEQEQQVRLVCLVILGLMKRGHLEPPGDYTLLYGQFVAYIGRVEEARSVYFSINERNQESSGSSNGGLDQKTLMGMAAGPGELEGPGRVALGGLGLDEGVRLTGTRVGPSGG